MNSMKPKFLIPISFLLLLSCQLISERMHRDEIISEAYVNNWSGITLYETKGDLKSKEVLLKRGEKLYFLEKSKVVADKSWRKVLYKGKELFMIGSDQSNFIDEYIQLHTADDRFGVTESEATLRDSPFGKEIEKVSSSSVFEIQASVNKWNYNLSDVKVKTQSNKVGFIYAEFERYKTELIAKKNSMSEMVKEDGYFRITTKTPVYLSVSSMLPMWEGYAPDHKEGDLLFVNYSKVIDGIGYYSFRFYAHRWPYLRGESSILIPESNGTFLNKKNFTDFTIQNLNYKGDKRIIDLLKKEDGYFLNFESFKLERISNNSRTEKYYLATVGIALSKWKESFLLKAEKDIYSIVISGLGDEFYTKDLDGDGNLEFFSQSGRYRDEAVRLFGMKGGKYQEIASFSTDSNIEKDIIHVGSEFTENLPSKDQSGYPETKSHPIGTKLKYQKGKLIKIK